MLLGVVHIRATAVCTMVLVVYSIDLHSENYAGLALGW